MTFQREKFKKQNIIGIPLFFLQSLPASKENYCLDLKHRWLVLLVFESLSGMFSPDQHYVCEIHPCRCMPQFILMPCPSVHMYMHFTAVRWIPGRGVMCQVIGDFQLQWILPNSFLKWLYQLQPQQQCEVLVALHPSPNLVLSVFKILAVLVTQRYCTMFLIYISSYSILIE